MERTCKKCGETKIIEEFPKNKYSSLGHIHTCKKCVRDYRRNNLINKRFYTKHKDKILKQQHAYYNKNRQEILSRQKLDRKRHPLKYKDIEMRKYKKNKIKIDERNKIYTKKNIEKSRLYKRKWGKKSIERCDDYYITRIIKRDFPEQIIKLNYKLIEIKRLQIQIKRQLNYNDYEKCN